MEERFFDEEEPFTEHVSDGSELSKSIPENLRSDEGWQTDVDPEV